MSHKTTVSQAHDAPTTLSSGRPDTAYIGRMDAIERTASCQLLGAYLNGLARKAAWALDRSHRAWEVRRTQANKVKLRLSTGATGHAEGNAILIRSVNS